MARSSSIISVSIIGDAQKLIAATGKADAATGGLIKSAAKVAGASYGIKKGFDAINDSLAEADRRGDAITRLEQSVGKIDTQKLSDTAGSFTDIGASSQDMLELEATYADLAISAGIAAPDIAKTAEQMAIAAVAAARIHDADPNEIISAIGKAAGGATKGLKPYGVDLTEAAVQQRALHDSGKDNPKLLTDTELAAARTALILEGFAGITSDSALASADLADKQTILGAKAEELGGKVGAQVEGPLTDALDWIIDMVDAIPGALDGWGMLGDRIQDVSNDIRDNLRDAIGTAQEFLGLLGDIARFDLPGPSRSGHRSSTTSDRSVSKSVQREQERNGLSTGMGVP